MTNIFDDNQSVPTRNIFEEVQRSENSPKQQLRNALYGTIAESYLGGTTELEKSFNVTFENIKQGYEDTHRKSLQAQEIAQTTFDPFAEPNDATLQATEELGLDNTQMFELEAVSSFQRRSPEELNQLYKSTYESLFVEQVHTDGVVNDSTQAASLEANPFDITASMKNIEINKMILRNEADKLGQDINDLNPVSWFISAASVFLTGSGAVTKTNRALGDKFSVFSSTARQEFINFLSLPTDEFMAKLPEFMAEIKDGTLFGDNPIAGKAALDLLLSGDMSLPSNQDWLTAESALEVFDTATIIGGVGTATTLGVIGKFNRPLANKLATSKVAQSAITRPFTGITKQKPTPAFLEDALEQTEVAEFIQPTSNIPQTGIHQVQLSGPALDDIERTRRALSQLEKSTVNIERYTSEELVIATEQLKKNLEVEFDQGRILDTTVFEEEDKIVVLVGKARGSGPFATEEAAQTVMANRGFTDGQVMQVRPGEWAIKVERKISDGAVVSPLDVDDIRNNPLSRVTSANIWSPAKYYADKVKGTLLKDKYRKGLQDALRPYSTLPRESIRDLNKVIELGRDWENLDADGVLESVGRWFDPEELNTIFERKIGRKVTDKELAAYYSFKDVNDFHYTVMNNNVYTELKNAGYMTASLPKLKIEGTAKRMQVPIDTSRISVYNITENKHHKFGEVSSDELRRLVNEEGYKLYSFNRAIRDTETNKKMFTFIAKEGDVVESPLDFTQVGYTPGGNRIVATPYFAKQLRTRKELNADGLETTIVESPYVHVGGESLSEVQKWVDDMNEVREKWLKFEANETSVTLSNLENAVAKTSIESVDNLRTLIKNGDLDMEHKFEAVFDNQLPSTSDLKGRIIEEFDSGIGSGFTQWNMHNKKQFTGSRGTRLNSVDGGKAAVLDPLSTMSRAIEHAADLGALGPMRDKWMEKWLKAATPYLKTPLDTRRSMRSQFLEADLTIDPSLQKADALIRTKMDRLRADMRRTMRIPTKAEEVTRSWKRGIAEWIDKDFVPTKIKNTAYGIARSDVSGTLRGMTFQTKMNFLNPVQLWLQMQTALQAVAIDPVNGFPALTTYAPMRLALYTGRPEEAFKQLGKVSSLSKDEFVELHRAIKDSGLVDISAELLDLDNSSAFFDVSPNSPVFTVAQKLEGAKKYGLVFFNEAEKLNRIVAAQIAMKRLKKLNPGKTLVDLQDDWVRLTNNLFVDMTTASKTALQQGPSSLFFQFKSYHQRLFEVIFDGLRNGGGADPAKLSRSDVARLGIAHLAMYGVGGTLGVSAGYGALDYMRDIFTSDGEELSPEMEQFIQFGFFDFITKLAFDADTAFGARAGVAGMASQLKDALTEDALLPVFMGASGQLIMDVAAPMTNTLAASAILFAHEESLLRAGDISADLFIDGMEQAVRTISTVDLAHKTLFAKRALRDVDSKFEITSKSGRALATVNNSTKWLQVLGFNPAEMVHLQGSWLTREEREKDLKAMRPLVTNLLREARESLGEERYRKIAAARILAMGLDPRDRRKLMNDASLGLTNVEKALNYGTEHLDGESFKQMKRLYFKDSGEE